MGVMVNFNWVIADAIRSRYEKPSGIKNPNRMRFISSLLYFDVHSVIGSIFLNTPCTKN